MNILHLLREALSAASMGLIAGSVPVGVAGIAVLKIAGGW